MMCSDGVAEPQLLAGSLIVSHGAGGGTERERERERERESAKRISLPESECFRGNLRENTAHIKVRNKWSPLVKLAPLRADATIGLLILIMK